ncbi:MAG: T9SS type A sorting domain-containing protein [Saprospiraceae bacterium]|nr:T9SS type A sorting domain-containing protein [Saprospiraceae bacterium]MDW8229104.1 T9SS type A sorting domain-containing protein [Saprospiraceae bacterium]
MSLAQKMRVCTAALVFPLLLRVAALGQSPFEAAPFTATDLQGRVWRLDSLLSAGKSVVLHFMATHCLPCWAYHQGKALQALYQQHGPGGTDRVRVFLVESDPATNASCLSGMSGCNQFTPGNWGAGTSFPILNDHAIAASYGITEYPTLVLICPTRKGYALRLMSANDLAGQIETCPVAFGQHNAALFDLEPGALWSDVCRSIDLTPRVRLVNLGQKPLQQAIVGVFWNDVLVNTFVWQGNLATYKEVALTLAPLTRHEAGTLRVQVLQLNAGVPDEDPSNNSRSLPFYTAPQEPGVAFLLKIRTDQFGAETYWELRNEQGQLLDFGGNQAVGPNGGGLSPAITGGPGAYGNNTIIYDTLYLPEPGCYSLHFVDAYGDGMCCANGKGYFQLYRLQHPLEAPILSGGVFQDYEHRRFNTDVRVGAAQPTSFKQAAARLWPNPAAEALHLELTWPYTDLPEVEIIDLLGRQVDALQTIEATAGAPLMASFEVSTLPAGLYWLCVRGQRETFARKFVVAH